MHRMVSPLTFLVKLARFVSPEERSKMMEDIKESTRLHCNLVDDPWGGKRRFLVISPPDYLPQLDKLLKGMPGIVSMYKFMPAYYNVGTRSLGDVVRLVESYCESQGLGRELVLDLVPMSGLPFHLRAVKDRLKKKKFTLFKEASGNVPVLYLDLKAAEGTVLARLGEQIISPPTEDPTPRLPVTLVLFSPYTTQEVADFFRLSLSFNVQVILTNENQLVDKLVAETGKTYFKGLSKISFSIEPSLEECLKQNPAKHVMGFSLWSRKTDRDLLADIRADFTNNHFESGWFLVFGNEKRGLEYQFRTRHQLYRLGVGSSEPLRASQAAAYALAAFAHVRTFQTPEV